MRLEDSWRLDRPDRRSGEDGPTEGREAGNGHLDIPIPLVLGHSYRVERGGPDNLYSSLDQGPLFENKTYNWECVLSK